MQEASRVQRWRKTKREHGLKAVTIWLSAEEELRLKDLAMQEHCSPSAFVQRALAQYTTTPRHSNPPDTLQIRRLILAELAALGIGLPTVEGSATGGDTVGPTDTQPATTPPPRPAPARKGGRPRSALGQQILALLADHPEGLSAEQLRGILTPARPIGDTLAGMKRLGTVRTAGQGKTLRYFAARA